MSEKEIENYLSGDAKRGYSLISKGSPLTAPGRTLAQCREVAKQYKIEVEYIYSDGKFTKLEGL